MWYPKYPSEVRHEHRPSAPRRRDQREMSKFLTSLGSLERTPRFMSPKPTPIRLVRVRTDQTGSSVHQSHLWFQNKHERSEMGVRRPETSPLVYIFPSLMHLPVSHCPPPASGPLPPPSGSDRSSAPLQPGCRAHSKMVELRNNRNRGAEANSRSHEATSQTATRQLSGQNSALSPGIFPILF